MDVTSQENINISFLWNMKTPYFADSVEWCPHPPFQNIFVCGMYQLEENTSEVEQKRLGAIHLFSTLKECICLQTLHLSGILDMKWCPYKVNEKCLLSVAFANGTVGLLQLVENDKVENGTHLEYASFFQINPDSPKLILSLDWCQQKEIISTNHLVVSESSGNIDLLQLTESEFKTKLSWQAHSHEAWIVCFDYHNANIIYSGGDDTYLKVWDSRMNIIKPSFTNKCHSMGVTSLRSSLQREYILISGSYDEVIRLWDTRKMTQPLNQTEVGGGIWRLKWQPYSEKHILAACNENGIHILKLLEDTSMKVVASNKCHSSLAYGADWSWLSSNSSENSFGSKTLFSVNNLIASCSFYDKYLCLWQVFLEE